jgi:hypothetical protein
MAFQLPCGSCGDIPNLVCLNACRFFFQCSLHGWVMGLRRLGGTGTAGYNLGFGCGVGVGFVKGFGKELRLFEAWSWFPRPGRFTRTSLSSGSSQNPGLAELEHELDPEDEGEVRR